MLLAAYVLPPLVNEASASCAEIPSPTSWFSVRTAVGESTASAYASAAPAVTPPASGRGAVTGLVFGSKAAPCGMVATLAPQR